MKPQSYELNASRFSPEPVSFVHGPIISLKGTSLAILINKKKSRFCRLFWQSAPTGTRTRVLALKGLRPNR